MTGWLWLVTPGAQVSQEEKIGNDDKEEEELVTAGAQVSQEETESGGGARLRQPLSLPLHLFSF